MKFKLIIGFFLVLSTLACGDLTISTKLISEQEIKPEINHRLTTLSTQDNGILFNLDKLYFAKELPETDCLKPIRTDNYNVLIDLNGNIANQSKRDVLGLKSYRFFKGKPYLLSTDASAGSFLSLDFFDLNLKKTSSDTYKIINLLSARNAKIKDKNYVYIISETEYYFYGLVELDNALNMYVVHVRNKKVFNIALSDPLYGINELFTPVFATNGSLYFLGDFNNEFNSGLNFSLFEYQANSDFLNSSIDIPSGFAYGAKKLIAVNENIVLLSNWKSGVTIGGNYVFNTNTGKLAKTALYDFLDKENNNPETELKVFEANDTYFIGYKNKTGESNIFKVEKDLKLSKAFKVSDLNNVTILSKGNKPAAYELTSPLEVGQVVKSKIRIHTDLNTIQEKVLFEGVGYRKLCGEY
jgi:hypothetical protein